jgi:hypothetical protein
MVPTDVIGLLHEMVCYSMLPNSATVSIIIPSVPLFSTLMGVKQAHEYAIRNNYDQIINGVTTLIDATRRLDILMELGWCLNWLVIEAKLFDLNHISSCSSWRSHRCVVLV